MKKIWAIARVTVFQGMRMRVVVVLALFLLIAVPALPFILKAPNSLLDRLRVVVTYCMYLTVFLMSLLTVFLSCGVLASEVKEKQIYVLDTKAIRRWQVLAGKWLGVMLLNSALLLLMGGASYGILRYIGRQRAHMPTEADVKQGMTMQQALRAQSQVQEQARAAAQILVARGSERPPVPDIAAEVEVEYQKLQEQGQKVSTRSTGWHLRMLRKLVLHRGFAVAPRTTRMWTIDGLPDGLGRDALMSLRFRHYSSGRLEGVRNENILGMWVMGPSEAAVTDVANRVSDLPSGQRSVLEAAADGHMVYIMAMDAPSASINETIFPSGVLSKDGKLVVLYRNQLYKGATARFPYDTGIEVLYPAGTLEINFLRGMLLAFLWLSFLAVLGLMSASFLGFPVAAFLSLVVMGISFSVPLWRDLAQNLFVYNPDWAPVGAYTDVGNSVIQAFTQGALFLFPDFSQYDPVPLLVEGRLIPTGVFLKGIVFLVLLRGGILALLGAYLFHRRELAGVIY